MFESKEPEFKQFIELINDPHFDQNKLEQAANLAIEIYSNGWRHSYAWVTKWFLDETHNDATELSDLLQSCYLNLQQIKLAVKEKGDNDPTRRSLEKLLDHVDLEMVRLDYFGRNLAVLKEQSKYTEGQLHKIEQISKNAQRELRNQKVQSITILGIFASIVITFVAGISVTNALLTNIQELSKWSMSFWSVLILGGVVNVLYSLYNMLYRLSGNRDKIIRWWSNWFNIGLFVLAIIFLLLSVATKP